jgi:hypothetical protein
VFLALPYGESLLVPAGYAMAYKEMVISIMHFKYRSTSYEDRLLLDPSLSSQWLALLVNATNAYKPSTFLPKNGPKAPFPRPGFVGFARAASSVCCLTHPAKESARCTLFDGRGVLG